MKSFALLSLTLSGCAKVEIENQEWCADLGVFGADCFHTLSNDHRVLDQDDWRVERYKMVCTKLENYAHIKEVILKLCRANKSQCSYEKVQHLDRIQEIVDEIYVVEGGDKWDQ